MESGDVARARSFDCGELALTAWIKTYAWLSHTSRSARVYVSLDSFGSEIAGYYSLSSGVALRSEAPERIGRGMPEEIPIQLIGRLGVDRRFQGQGIGKHLVLDALKNVLKVSEITGVRAVMVRSKPGAVDFYKGKLQFEQSVSDPLLLFFIIKDIKKTLRNAGIA